MIFRRFLTTLRRFRKIFQNCSEGQTNIPKHFPRISETFRRSLKISEDCQKASEEDPKMFRWYTNEFKYNLREKLDISEIINIFTCEDIVLFLSICYHSVYHRLLYNKCRTVFVIVPWWYYILDGMQNLRCSFSVHVPAGYVWLVFPCRQIIPNDAPMIDVW